MLARGRVRRLPGRAGGRAANGGARLRHDPVHGRHGVTAGRSELRQPRIAQVRPTRGGAEHGAGARPVRHSLAHIIIDGQIGADDTAPTPDSRLRPEAIAPVYLDLHRQQRSAWTQEMDLRPWVERF